MTQKIEGKFYPLTPEIGQKLRAAKLTAAEWRLWCYLIEIDPFGEQYKDLPDTLTILKEVGISKPTFYRAIAKFQKLNLFDFQDKGFSFRNLTRVSKIKPDSQKGDNRFKNETENLKNETDFSKLRQVSQKRENQSPKLLPYKASSSPKISKTYLDFIDSLSEGEREKFLEFGLKKARELPKPPTLPQKWVERNFKELYAEFLRQPSEAIATSQDWANHPQREEWIAEMREKGEWAFFLQVPKPEQPERQAFRDWANANNLIWPELGNGRD
jgi:hypothetical protein